MDEIKPIVLIADDDTNILHAIKEILEENYTVLIAQSGTEAIQKINNVDIDIVILDILMPDINGIKILKQIKEINPDTDVVVVSAVKDVKTAIEAMKLGAYDYLTKPFEVEEILACLNRIVEKRKMAKDIKYFKSVIESSIRIDNIVGESEPMKQIFQLIKEMSNSDTTVTIYGESGTGKELVARAIHYTGKRKDRPFIVVDCPSIPENLIESELFGHEKGAFTDAVQQKIGKFELANTGTIFLDEISNLKMSLQSKLLRVLQEKEFTRVGGTKIIKTDVRVICATNSNLKELVDKNAFRNDLYYRINVVPIYIPPLRERKEDIPILISHFLKIYNAKFKKNIEGFSKKAMDFLMRYSWPGNIRELQNVIERLVALSKDKIISHRKLPLEILLCVDKLEEEKIDLSIETAVDEFERRYLIGILEKVHWNQSKASRILGVHRNTIIYKMKKLGIVEPKDEL